MGFYFKNKFSEDDDVFPKAKLGQCKKLPISINLRNNIIFDNPIKNMICSLDEINMLAKNFSDLLKSKFRLEKISKKIENWHELDFGIFLKELEKAIKKTSKENNTELEKMSLTQEAEWMQYFNERKQKAQVLQSQIVSTEKEIDQMVYELYGLTEEEIEIVENS
jgi:hypothetical protein